MGHVPSHVAIVMDGNGRWAQTPGPPSRTEGHVAGEAALFDVVEGALRGGVAVAHGVCAFSTENWRRPLDEVRFLMRFNETLLLTRRDYLNERGVRVRFIGRRSGRVPGGCCATCRTPRTSPSATGKLTLTFAFNYGGRAEIVDAARRMATEVKEGQLRPEKINERLLRRYLYGPDMPDPDLLVRTSGSIGCRTSCSGSWRTRR